MAVPGVPAAEDLKSLGARRLSAGAALWAASLGEAMRLGREFEAQGDSTVLFTPASLKGGWVNGLFNA